MLEILLFVELLTIVQIDYSYSQNYFLSKKESFNPTKIGNTKLKMPIKYIIALNFETTMYSSLYPIHELWFPEIISMPMEKKE